MTRNGDTPITDPTGAYMADERSDRERAVDALVQAFVAAWPDMLASMPDEHKAQARQGAIRSANRELDYLMDNPGPRRDIVEYLTGGQK